MKSNIKKDPNWDIDQAFTLKPEITEKISGILGLDEQSLSALVVLLQLPDEQFDAIYPTYKKKMEEIFTTEKGQREVKEQLRLTPVVEIEEMKKELPDFIHELTDDENLSENKKDIISSIFTGALNLIEELQAGGLRDFVPVKIVKLNQDAFIPKYAHPTDCGADVCSVETTRIEAGETKIVKTGLAVAIPAGYEIQVRPRSGLSLKSGLRIANAPGTIDADFRGEVGIIMTNTGETAYVIDKGMKIAQLVIAPTPRIKWEEVNTLEELGSTERGKGGFGSTGTKS